jgi:hypothetical protein
MAFNFALALPVLTKLFSGGAKGMQQDRQTKDAANLQRDQLALQQENLRQNALLDRARLDLQQREADAKARQEGFAGALRSASIQQWQPAARPNGVPSISFVRKPDSAALPEYERQMMLRLLQGEQFDALPQLPTMRVSQPAQASTWEKIAGGLGLGAGIWSALSQIKQGQSNPYAESDEWME